MLRLGEDGFIFPVVDARIKYLTAARYDDELVVRIWFVELSRLKLGFASEVLRKDGLLLVACKTHHVCTDTHDKPRRMDARCFSLLSPYLEVALPNIAGIFD